MLALIGAVSGVAVRSGSAAAGLVNRDYEFLQSEFGFERDGFLLKNISAADTARLARIMHDPTFSATRESLRLNLATLLLYIERNTCEDWEETNHSSPCPEVNDARFLPGWAVAERHCIACHLTGTTMAQPFFRMARENAVDDRFLATQLASSHAMSPIGLSEGDLRDLSAYINSLR